MTFNAFVSVCRVSAKRPVHSGVVIAFRGAVLGALLSQAVVGSAHSAGQTLACRQLGDVSQMSAPAFDASSANVNLIIGSHYWACPCGEPRKLVGDNEQRKLVGDSEQRNLVGDNEQRKLVGDNEQRKIVGGSEQHQLVGDHEQRTLVGDAGGVQCRSDASCGGFALIGVNIGGVKVIARSGSKPVVGSCVDPY